MLYLNAHQCLYRKKQNNQCILIVSTWLMAWSIVHHHFILFILTVINCFNFLLPDDPDILHAQHHRNFLKEHVVFKEVMYRYLVVVSSFFLQVGVRIGGGRRWEVAFFLQSRGALSLYVAFLWESLLFMVIIYFGCAQAIPIKDPMVLSKIHQTYRVGYLKVWLFDAELVCYLPGCICSVILTLFQLFQDVVLPRVLDEATVANLNSIIHSNNAVVRFSNSNLQPFFRFLCF